MTKEELIKIMENSLAGLERADAIDGLYSWAVEIVELKNAIDVVKEMNI